MDDLTSEELAPKLLAAALAHVPFDGWSQRAIDQAADDIGVPRARAHLVFPTGGMDLLETHLTAEREWLTAALDQQKLADMRIRERIRTAIATKFSREAEHREATRRAVTLLALPHNTLFGARHVWLEADIMWRAAGDTATDFNYYSKRTILSGILSATMLYWLNDDSEDYADTAGFIERRIEGVMRFEKLKARVRKLEPYRPSLTRFLGRLRYPDR